MGPTAFNVYSPTMILVAPSSTPLYATLAVGNAVVDAVAAPPLRMAAEKFTAPCTCICVLMVSSGCVTKRNVGLHLLPYGPTRVGVVTPGGLSGWLRGPYTGCHQLDVF
jgi:hypothetical protein